MSASNWLGGNGESHDSPDPSRSNRYQVDNVGLQFELGLPLELLDLQGLNAENFQGSNSSGRFIRSERFYTRPVSGTLPRQGHNNRQPVKNRNHISNDEILHTIDGIPIRNVYVTNITVDTSYADMYRIFGFYGEVVNVYLGHSAKGFSKFFAFVTYFSPKDAARVLKMRRVGDFKTGQMFVKAADSWHQPVEGPNGQIFRRPQNNSLATQEDDVEEEDVVVRPIPPIQAIEETKDSLNVLNDDCLMHIFSLLNYKEMSGVERVCKRWQALSHRIWSSLRELPLSQFSFGILDLMNTRMLERYLKRCGEFLTVLDMAIPDHDFSPPTLAIVAKHCTNLETLRVSNIEIGSRSLAHLGRRCPHLKYLSIDTCFKFNDSDLMSLFPKCSQLSRFELCHNNTVIGKCLANIKNPITDLKLWECTTLQPQYLISGLQNISSTLRNLSLSTNSSLSTKDVNAIVAAVPGLHSLSLRRSLSQFQISAPLSLGRLAHLTSLDLSINTNVTDQVISSIIDGCENLSTLDLSGCSGGCVGALTERGLSMLGRLRKLTVLNISYLDTTNNTVLTNITTRNNRLRELVCRGCPQLGDEGSSHVVSMCTELELLDLSGCDITQLTVTSALTSVKMRNNNVHLKLIVGGTNVTSASPPEGEEPSPQLTVDLQDLCEEHMRPDFFDMFFPASDSEDDDDLDHLCCDCDFDYDDLYDPTLFPGDFEDDTPKFGDFIDYDDANEWVDDEDENEDDEVYVRQSIKE